MSTNFKYIKGMAKWCVTQQPDSWGYYKVTLYPDSKSLEEIRDMQAVGLKNVLKKDEEGYHVTLRRPAQKEIRGKMVTFTPPEVLGPDGKTPLDSPIGNGSEVTLKLAVYSHNTPGGGKAIAARLEAVKVDKLIPYTDRKEHTELMSDEPLF